jgi:LPXTG-motif cell wall-anchored protein
MIENVLWAVVAVGLLLVVVGIFFQKRGRKK